MKLITNELIDDGKKNFKFSIIKFGNRAKTERLFKNETQNDIKGMILHNGLIRKVFVDQSAFIRDKTGY